MADNSMIYELSRALEGLMIARKYPVTIVYTERLDLVGWSPGIFMGEDLDKTDTFEPWKGADQNPRAFCMRWVPVRARVGAASNLIGAHLGDHRRETHVIVNGLIGAIFQQSKTSHWPSVRFTGGKFLRNLNPTPDQAPWPGAVYEFTFACPTAVRMVDYEGNGQAEAVIASVENDFGVSGPPQQE